MNAGSKAASHSRGRSPINCVAGCARSWTHFGQDLPTRFIPWRPWTIQKCRRMWDRMKFTPTWRRRSWNRGRRSCRWAGVWPGVWSDGGCRMGESRRQSCPLRGEDRRSRWWGKARWGRIVSWRALWAGETGFRRRRPRTGTALANSGRGHDSPCSWEDSLGRSWRHASRLRDNPASPEECGLEGSPWSVTLPPASSREDPSVTSLRSVTGTPDPRTTQPESILRWNWPRR